MRYAHYLTANKASESPSNCIYFDTETLDRTIDESTKEAVLNFGWACIRRKRYGEWSAESWIRFESRGTFWEWVNENAHEGQKLYIYAHNLNFDASVMGMLSQLDDLGWELQSAIMDDPPTMFKFRKGKATIQLVDTFNYFNMSLKALGKVINLEKYDMPAWETATREQGDAYCKRDVEIIMRAMEKQFDFVKAHDLGNFAVTQAAQAFNAYRHRFMDFPIYIDTNADALKLARSSYYGGRVEAFRIGKIPGKVYKLDVNSMYPFVMSKHKFPTKLLSYMTGDINPESLRSLFDHYGLVANVTIETDRAYYPYVHESKLLFPVGDFDACYSKPELEFALNHGHIKAVHSLAIYEEQMLFAKYVNYFYSMRKAATEEGRTEEAYLLKISMNSLYGKFGQNGRKWENDSEADTLEVKTWNEIDAKTEVKQEYRQVGRIIQKMAHEDESQNSHPAIASTITGYARVYLLEMMLLAGMENVYYCDTDCLFTSETGYEKLKWFVDPTVLGMLKLEEVSEAVTILGLKDYTFGEHTKLKGIRSNIYWVNLGSGRHYHVKPCAMVDSPLYKQYTMDELKKLKTKLREPFIKCACVDINLQGENTFEQDKFQGWRGKIRDGNMDRMIISKVKKRVSHTYNKGKVSVNGRVEPFVLG